MKFVWLQAIKDKKFNRVHFLFIVLIIIIFLLLGRLFYLQIIMGNYYYEISEKKIMQKITTDAPRGSIYDRYGNVLADNRPAYVVQIVKTSKFKSNSEKAELTKQIIQILNILNRNNEKLINNFKIVLNPIRFDFGNLKPETLKKVEKQWKKDRKINEKWDAKKTFNELKKRFFIPSNISDDLALQIMAIEDMIFYNYYQLYQPITIAIDVSQKTVASLEENKRKFPFINIDVKPVRIYKNALFNAHIIGRIGKISQDEYEKLKDDGYTQDSIIGIEGIEKKFEKYLKGEQGIQFIEVDKFGRVNKSTNSKYSKKGANITLTIDEDLQIATYKSLEKVLKMIQSGYFSEKYPDAKAGAAAVINVKTGDVLALVSYPSYDPNIFIRGIKIDEWQKLINDKTRPMFNRAIAGSYPPGSTFKILTAIAGLQEKVITPNEKILDTGRYLYFASSGFTPACWIWNRYHRTHGWVNVSDALKVSCNVFFYETGRRLGISKISKYATLFGLGEKTNIQIDGESKGVLANPENKKKIFSQSWYPGDTVIAAIGQSINAFTPIQMASFISTVANGGIRYQVNIVKEISTNDGQILLKSKPKVLNTINMDKSTKEAIFEGMKGVTSEEGGTARAAFNGLPFIVAGKTGTSQFGSSKNNHGWFVGFAPYDDPQIAFAIVIEKGGHGSYASYVARDIIDTYFGLNQSEQKLAK